MGGRIAVPVFLLPAVLAGQITVYTVAQGGATTAVGAFLDLGEVPASDYLDTRMRLVNTGQARVTLQQLWVRGQSFAILGDPSLPYIMAPGTNVDFRVRFQPTAYGSYSASLQVNELVIMLRGSSPAGPTVLGEQQGRLVPLGAESVVDFGMVERKSGASRRFEIRNETASRLEVRHMEVTPGPFTLAPGLRLPLLLDPGQVVPFDVRFAPERVGVWKAALQVDSRTFRLEGFAREYPFPEPRIVLPGDLMESGRQATLKVELAGPSGASGIGTLTIELQGFKDPGIQFLAGSGRTLRLELAEGGYRLSHAGEFEIPFQTGTTAGTVVFRLELGEHRKEAPLQIPPQRVVIQDTQAGRTPTGFRVSLVGFDNTRSASQIAFTFYDQKGIPIGQEPIRTDVSEDFRRYFQTSDVGGMFALRAMFPAAGDRSLVSAVEVEVTNSAGQLRTQRVAF